MNQTQQFRSLFTVIPWDALSGPPRNILMLTGWNIGKDPYEQRLAALYISCLLAFLLITVYVLTALIYCKRRAPQDLFLLRPVEIETPETKGPEALWTVHNKRYDLSSFVAQHPGGVDAIKLGRGRNCTELFESYHSLANEKKVRMVLEEHYVEDVEPGASDYESQFEWQDTPFFDALKSRVRAHFHQKEGMVRPARDYRANFQQWTHIIVFVLASCSALYGFMCGSWLCTLALPFVYWWGPSPCLHDGAHFSLSKRPWINRFFGYIGGAHMSLFSWYHQHNIGHHVHPNIPNYDPDLYHFALDADNGSPGFRTSIELRTLPEKTFFGIARSTWWRMGLLLRVPLSTFGPSLSWDIHMLADPIYKHSYMGIVPLMDLSTQGLVIHSMGRCTVVWLAVLHPLVVTMTTADGWICGLCMSVLYVLVPITLHGTLFYAFSQVSHIQHQCFGIKASEVDCEEWHHDHPGDKLPQMIARMGLDVSSSIKPAAREAGSQKSQSGSRNLPVAQRPGDNSKEWAVHQVQTSLDYAVDSFLWLHLSNGLNLQAVHHLFPQVGWGHYVELSAILKEVCDEFGVVYTTAPDFWTALSWHYKYLVDINNGPYASVWVRPPTGNVSRNMLYILDQLDDSDFLFQQAQTQKRL